MELERPKFWQSLRSKIPLSFIVGALLFWLIATVMTTFIGYHKLNAAIETPEFYQQVRQNLPALAAAENTPHDRAFQLAQMSERLKDEHRNIGSALYYCLERYDFSAKEFAALSLTDARGEPLESVSARLTGNPQTVSKTLSDEEKSLIENVLREKSEKFGSYDEAVQLFALPVTENSEIKGVLLIESRVPFSILEVLNKLLIDFVFDLREVWLYLVLFGLFFGLMQANQVMRELDKIALAVKSWSNGDFTARAALPAKDELGVLARRLDKMATELSDIFEMKQTLAAADERARIARDLHDSVKQQVFSLSLQIGAAHSLFERDRVKSFARIEESQKLTAQVQNELVELISELRLTNEKKSKFEDRVKNYLTDWARQNGVAVEFETFGTSLLIPSVEHALFRIFQEVLANVARHAQAARVEVSVTNLSTNNVKIKVADDGRGFDLKKTKKGFGLQNMKERIAALEDGFIMIESRAGEGTEIEFGVSKKQNL